MESLPQLEVLGLQYEAHQELDLSHFTKLRVALLRWSKGLDTLFTLPTVELLNIQNYPYEDLTPILSMTQLKKLYITSRKLKTLTGIEQLPELEVLDLYNCPFLTSLDGTEKLKKLNTLEIKACKRVGDRTITAKPA